MNELYKQIKTEATNLKCEGCCFLEIRTAKKCYQDKYVLDQLNKIFDRDNVHCGSDQIIYTKVN